MARWTSGASPQHIVGGHFGGQRHGGFQRTWWRMPLPGCVGRAASRLVDAGHHDGAIPVIMVPLFTMFRACLIGTFGPLWVPAWFGNAFSIFLMRQFFMTIPRELDDAIASMAVVTLAFSGTSCFLWPLQLCWW